LQQPAAGGNRLCIIFYVHKIVVTLIKDGKYQLVNSFCYSKAEDVTYILLDICQQFQLKDVALEISGLIEANSPLYTQIHKYFQSIVLSPFPENRNCTEEITQHPSHYFSHIFALDLCE
jgi:predicted metal-dependent RNase